MMLPKFQYKIFNGVEAIVQRSDYLSDNNARSTLKNANLFQNEKKRPIQHLSRGAPEEC